MVASPILCYVVYHSDNTSPYTGQVMGVVMTPSLLELAEEEESDVDLLGFYPNFNHDRAMVRVIQLCMLACLFVTLMDREFMALWL